MPDNLTAPLHRFLAEGMSVDQAIGELRRIGFDRELTIRALCQVMSLSREQAEARLDRNDALPPQLGRA